MSKYKIVYRDANPSRQELCPVRVLAVQVSRDTETGACFLQTKIVNVSTKPISRIEFTVGLEGEGGETENVDFSLLDADLPAGEVLRPKAVRIKLSVITGSRAVVTRADGETSFGDPIDIDSPRATRAHRGRGVGTRCPAHRDGGQYLQMLGRPFRARWMVAVRLRCGEPQARYLLELRRRARETGGP